MEKQPYYIQPLEQIIIWPDVLSRPKKVLALDKLNDDLSFDKNIANSRTNENPWNFWVRMIDAGEASSNGWVVVYDKPKATPAELWPKAMEKLGQGKLVKR